MTKGPNDAALMPRECDIEWSQAEKVDEECCDKKTLMRTRWTDQMRRMCTFLTRSRLMPTSHHTCKDAPSIIYVFSKRRVRTNNQRRQESVCSRLHRAPSDVFQVIFEQWFGSASNGNRQFSATASFYKIAHNGSHVFSRARAPFLYLRPETWLLDVACVFLRIAEEAKSFVFLPHEILFFYN